MIDPQTLRIALVHDWITGMRGGERVLEVLCRLFPQAQVFTLLHVKGSASPAIEAMPIRTSFVQHLPLAARLYRHYLPLHPAAVERLDLKNFDLVVSTSHCVAKGAIPPPQACHISYVLTPMRYIWDCHHDYFGRQSGPLTRAVMTLAANYLRMWDVTSSHRVTEFAAISHHVAMRIHRYYGRDATVLHPPVTAHRFSISSRVDTHYLVVSALVPYKRVDLAVRACSTLDRPLLVIGSGQEEKRLKRMAGPQVTFLGWQSDEVVAQHLARCQALLFPGEEDYGIVPLEAMAAGRPVIAFARGGILETSVPLDSNPDRKPNDAPSGPNAILFNEQTPESLAEAIRRYETVRDLFDPNGIRAHALKFDVNRFAPTLRDYILQAVERHRSLSAPEARKLHRTG